MVMQMSVFKETHQTWPGKNGKSGGERWSILCLDVSEPVEHRLESFYEYTLTDAERAMYWGKLGGHTVELGVTSVMNGNVRPFFRGSILGVR